MSVQPGTRIEVRSLYDRQWARGFEMVEEVTDRKGSMQYRVRRRSDGSVLPTLFIGEDVRRERPKNDMWWM